MQRTLYYIEKLFAARGSEGSRSKGLTALSERGALLSKRGRMPGAPWPSTPPLNFKSSVTVQAAALSDRSPPSLIEGAHARCRQRPAPPPTPSPSCKKFRRSPPPLLPTHPPSPPGSYPLWPTLSCQSAARRARRAGAQDSGRPSHLTTWSKERGKRQSEFGLEMQSNEVSAGNAKSPLAGNTVSLVQNTRAPAQGIIEDPHAERITIMRPVRHGPGPPGPENP